MRCSLAEKGKAMREKLIELITDKENDLIRKIVWFTDTYRIKEVADHLIANGVTIATDNNVGDKSSPTGWIPVSERLPQGADGKSLCKNVIAYTIDGQVVPGWLNGAYWYLLLLDDTAFTRLERDCVTHWMPLPQPPKEEV